MRADLYPLSPEKVVRPERTQTSFAASNPPQISRSIARFGQFGVRLRPLQPEMHAGSAQKPRLPRAS
jgi:hypothetical protein